MDRYERNRNAILRLFPDLPRMQPGDSRKVEKEGYMPLSLDVLRRGFAGDTLPCHYVDFALAHNYRQNRDLMADPDMEIRLYLDERWPKAEVLAYQQDNLGIYQRVYALDQAGRRTVNPRLKRELNAFLETWLRNLRRQGFEKAAQEARAQ